MPFTKNFTELSKTDAHIAGGKGASLGEMSQAGIPVPPGFVILAQTFESFIKETDLIQEITAALGKVDHKSIHTVDTASETIRALIEAEEVPKAIAEEIFSEFEKLGSEFVAVRSSATAEDGAEHAWAGQLESYLNTTKETLLENVKHCWASLFTPRAIFYRFEKGLDTTHISVAVVVQKMVESEISGIAFSVHPITEDYNQLIIEAGFGLGEAIVSGSVTPDSYVVEKEPRNILDINISTQNRALYRSEKTSKDHGNNEWVDIPEPKSSSQVLTKAQILELSEIILKIENHYGFPCDIEWAYEEGKFYIVQSRPITTLSIYNELISTSKLNSTLENKNQMLDIYNAPIVFEKIYTRDTTIIMQEFWGQTCTEGVSKRYGIHNPNRPEIIHFMFEGSIEIWENKAATKFLTDAIYEKNSADENFMPTALNVFKAQVEDLKAYWGKDHADSLEEFKSYIDKARDALTNFIPYYYSAVDDRTPQRLRDMALEFRNKDFFFANSDTFIRNSLVHLYPEVKGYETAITTHELENIPTHAELESRRTHMTLIDGIERTTETLAELQARRPELVFVSDKSEFSGQEIKGQIAYKGLVRGMVRILRRRDQIPMVQEGEIIVSPMTTPDFLPAMEKAAAFVTDEGGITCHAGIVAREMKKPCIIGTKIATKIFKDGDMVEVDADKGIVRKIN